jgi:hypothetical protein
MQQHRLGAGGHHALADADIQALLHPRRRNAPLRLRLLAHPVYIPAIT